MDAKIFNKIVAKEWDKLAATYCLYRQRQTHKCRRSTKDDK